MIQNPNGTSRILMCHKCEHKVELPYNTHIQCIKPDPKMKGEAHGIVNGWFFYPVNFDPIWATKDCENFKPIESEK